MSERVVRILTAEVVQMVEEYVYKELSDAEKYENRSPLDESGIWSLHALAAEIYAAAFGPKMSARIEGDEPARCIHASAFGQCKYQAGGHKRHKVRTSWGYHEWTAVGDTPKGGANQCG